MTDATRPWAWKRLLAGSCLAALAGACMQTALRAPGDDLGAAREPARAWSVGGIYRPEHVLDPRERPLRARLAPGETIPLWLTPDGAHFGGAPRVRWVSTRPEVADAKRAGSSLGAKLRAHALGEAEVYALVRVHGGVRASLAYYCCADGCSPELPRCESIPIARVVVAPRSAERAR